MRKVLLSVINISILVPCVVFGSTGPDFMTTIWIWTFIVSILNLFLSNSRKDFLIGCLLILVASSMGMCINGQLYYHSLVDKQIWYDLEGNLTYFVATIAYGISYLVIMMIEFIIKHLIVKRKTNCI
ncbi:MAG: hypothetical protein J5984_04120 [Clostridia bacterium]|nr:hypothetical protein [Clostridia bacterium]